MSKTLFGHPINETDSMHKLTNDVVLVDPWSVEKQMDQQAVISAADRLGISIDDFLKQYVISKVVRDDTNVEYTVKRRDARTST